MERGVGERERHLGACPLPGTPRVYMVILELPSYLAREPLGLGEAAVGKGIVSSRLC